MAANKSKNTEVKRRKRSKKMSGREMTANSAASERKYEVGGVIIMALSLICLCGLFNFNVGYVGLYFAKVSKYLFGVGVWLMLIATFLSGWRAARDHVLFADRQKSLGAVLGVISFCALLHHLFVPVNGELLPENLVSGGGIIGGLSLFAIRKVLGIIGGMIFYFAAFVCSIILTTGFSLSWGIKKTEESIKNQRNRLVRPGDDTREGFADKDDRVRNNSSVSAASIPNKDASLINQNSLKKELPPPLPLDFDTTIQHLDKTPEDERLVQNALKESTNSGELKLDGLSYSHSGGKLYNQADEDDFITSASDADDGQNVSYPDFQGVGTGAGYQDTDPNGPSTIITRTKTAVERLEEKHHALKAENLFKADIKKQEPVSEELIEQEVEETVPAADEPKNISADVPEIHKLEEDEDYTAETENEMIPISEYKSNIYEPVSANEEERTEEAAEPEGLGQGIITPTELDDFADNIGSISDDGGSGDDNDAAVTEPGEAPDELESADPEIKVETPEHSNTVVKPKYIIPSVKEILSKLDHSQSEGLRQEINNKAEILSRTMADFKVNASIVNACHGPAVTRFEVSPAPGVKVSKITNLADDLALALAAVSVRIEPIPGKSAVGIEVPNEELEGVGLRDVLEHPDFAAAKSKLTCGIGMDISGEPVFADIAAMPHLLVAGATGSGKSVCINTLITSILFKATSDEVKFILIDPKTVELSNYNGIPHLMIPVVTDMKKAASALNWAVQEMEKRYAKLAASGVRNMESYNKIARTEGWDVLPSIVIIIDELADLMMVAPKDVEDAICRIAQKARAAGIHLVLATQRPSVDVITGIIKANIPSRISFAVSSQIDSRTILDASGAEKLLGKGDMLFSPVGTSKPQRVQGAFISDSEVEKLVNFIKSQGQEAEINQELVDFTENDKAKEENEGPEQDDDWKDELLDKAVELVMTSGTASTSYIQRRLRIGYSRAARIIDMMEELGIIGPSVAGNKPREILMTQEEARELLG